MKPFSLFATALALGLCAVSAKAASFDGYTSFFVFGDSLSDNGNLFAATGGGAPASPPYFNGRFSNGPVWAEAIAAEFAGQGSVTANFAFGGANAVTNGDGIPDLPFQLGIFGASVPGAALGSKPLASLWFGANDLFDAVDDFAAGLSTIPEVEAVGRAAAAAVAAGAAALRIAGINDFVILNLPDLGSLPAYALFEPGSVGAATAGSDAFNAELDTRIGQLRADKANVTEIDINGLFDSLLAKPKQFGVLDATHPCLIPGFSLCTPDQVGALAFFDPVHPTSTIHSAIADAVDAALAPVPLPLPASMLGLALVGLGLVASRRSRTMAGNAVAA